MTDEETTLAGTLPKSFLVTQTQQQGQFAWRQTDTEVKSVAQGLVKDIPTYEAHIEDYQDADDPDAGIEDEYHPKHDMLYCWRARRLLAGEKLYAVEAMADGDLQKGMKVVAGEVIQGSKTGLTAYLRPITMKQAPKKPEKAEEAKVDEKSRVKVEKMKEDEGPGFASKSEKGADDFDGKREAPATASSAGKAIEEAVVPKAEKETAPLAAPTKKAAKKRKR